MSILSILSPNRRQVVARKPLLNILRQIQSGDYQTEINQLREYSLHHPELSEDLRHDLIPWFSIAGHFKKRGPLWDLITYSQQLLLELTHLSEVEMVQAKEQLSNNDFVLACFKNAEGTGLCCIIATNGTLEQHSQSFQILRSYLLEYLGIERISEKGRALEYCCRFSWDPELYLNWDAEPFGIFLNKSA